MFRNLRETIITLNGDVNNVANCEKAKNLRKKLLSIGLPMAIIGFLGVFICFAAFVIIGFSSVGGGGFPAGILIPFILTIPCGVVGSIGAMIAGYGFRIVITGYSTNLINETVGNSCPSCGKTIDSEMDFCSNCGTKIKKECSNCNHINSSNSKFCEKCGTKLD
ncbi:MAG: zinc ribbon domain-containing protein [Clostridia bacterium]|nr:zinc ribbon domain-containing protein [Clostridia bacterium]